MRITRNEKYSCWALLGIRTFWTCSKLSYQPAEATRTRRTLFELIVIVIVIARMSKNDQEWSLEQTRIVNSSSFGSRFGTVGLGHYRDISPFSSCHYTYLYTTCNPYISLSERVNMNNVKADQDDRGQPSSTLWTTVPLWLSLGPVINPFPMINEPLGCFPLWSTSPVISLSCYQSLWLWQRGC